MRRTHIYMVLLACALTLLVGCKGNNDVLSVAEMSDVLFDIYRFEGTAAQIGRTMSHEEKVSYYDAIFAKHHTTKQQYDNSLKWYAEHPVEWRMVYHNLEARGKKYADQLKNDELPEMKKR